LLPLESPAIKISGLIKYQYVEDGSHKTDWLSIDKLQDSLDSAHTLRSKLRVADAAGIQSHIIELRDAQTINAVAVIEQQETERKTHGADSRTVAAPRKFILPNSTRRPTKGNARHRRGV
jgi:hypothetical protein